MHSVWAQNKRLCTIVDLPTEILASLFAPLMLAGLHNKSPLLTMVEPNRPYSYSRYWAGTSLQLRLMQGVFSNANGIDLCLMIFPRMSLRCKLVPVQYREYEYSLFQEHSNRAFNNLVPRGREEERPWERGWVFNLFTESVKYVGSFL